MGCASSKRVDDNVAIDVYHPPASSISLFDISKVQEPWVITTSTTTTETGEQELEKKPTHLPLPPLLDKLDTFDLTPKSWSEVSKALEDLKPSLQNQPPPKVTPPSPKPNPNPSPSSNSNSIRTIQDLNTKQNQNQKQKPKPSDSPPRPPLPELSGHRPVQQNSFLLRDRQERETKKEGWRWKRRDPLEGYPLRPPPGNSDGVVLYTTSLRGVRRTFEDCERTRRALEGHAAEAGVEVDGRDVSLHGEYLKEVRELAGEGVMVAVPRLFIRGRYVGGVEEVMELGETGKLREMLRTVPAKGDGVKGGRGCEGCGGARFVPCLECNGSCKVLDEDGKGTVRCGKCNENGLELCPICH